MKVQHTPISSVQQAWRICMCTWLVFEVMEDWRWAQWFHGLPGSTGLADCCTRSSLVLLSFILVLFLHSFLEVRYRPCYGDINILDHHCPWTSQTEKYCLATHLTGVVFHVLIENMCFMFWLKSAVPQVLEEKAATILKKNLIFCFP